jgi:hypothetical protein
MRKATRSVAVQPDRDAEYKARKAAAAATLNLKNLDETERAFLATCQKIYRRHSGCTSPFEEFFRILVLNVEHDTWPTPDDVSHELESFKRDFEDMDERARIFVESYPAPAMSPATPASVPAPPTRTPAKQPAKAQRKRKPRKQAAHA